MNSLNHFLISFIALSSIVTSASISEIIVFSLIFGVALDLNQMIGRNMNKPKNHHRTWIEEPFGILIIGMPLGFLLGLIKKEYFLMTIIPYILHIVLDYLTIHSVCPLAPFSKKELSTGFFKSIPTSSWYKGDERGISENYFLILTLLIMFIIFF